MSHSHLHLSRRHFLAGTAAATGLSALALPASLLTAAQVQQLKLGLVTYNWGKDWDLPTVIANCEATGYAGVR